MSEPRDNERWNAALKRRLQDRGIRWYPMEGTADDGAWPSEAGVFALAVSKGRAESLGQEFRQTAVVWGRSGATAELVWCNRLKHVTRNDIMAPPAPDID
jgi:hypothetical protein